MNNLLACNVILIILVTNTELLLKYGANVELANNSGSRPIHMANDVESLKLLLDFGADVNAVDKVILPTGVLLRTFIIFVVCFAVGKYLPSLRSRFKRYRTCEIVA